MMTESEKSDFASSFCRGLEQLHRLPAGSINPAGSIEVMGGWTSLDQIEFILFADETYGVNLSGDQLRSCRTVGDLMTLIPHPAE